MNSSNNSKRKKNTSGGDRNSKKAKYFRSLKNINPQSAGIFATCGRRQEKKCISELSRLFNDIAKKYFNISEISENNSDEDEDSQDDELDIESAINKELGDMKKKNNQLLIKPIELGCECVVFFRIRKPLDPVLLVYKLCELASESKIKRTRYTQRLTPVSSTAVASEEELKKLSEKCFASIFHAPENEVYKFAIRPTIRNNSTLDRDTIIQTVASSVGKPHIVDLKNYDKLILVECFKNIVGIAVVNNDFESLKRFNLEQIFMNNNDSTTILSRVKPPNNVESTDKNTITENTES